MFYLLIWKFADIVVFPRWFPVYPRSMTNVMYDVSIYP